MPHPELSTEQAYVDRAYARLEAMRSAARAMVREAFGEHGGTFQATTERDIRVRQGLVRLERLELGRESLVFGRIDGHSEPTSDQTAEPTRYYIGRLAVSDEDQEPLVVDWRAPVAEPFYRATGAQPMGLTRRRHFLTSGPKVIDIEDELFDPEGNSGMVGLGLAGSQVLMASLERARTGRMRDIVATVQAEQDEIIRAPLQGALVVQGGPGTGKTAVALHRAAYLLYTYRFPLEHQGVLVVGPNPTYLRYIEHVLPSLDETGVEISTVLSLYRRTRPMGREPARVAALKGDHRMAQVISNAVASRERPLRREVAIPFGGRFLRLEPAVSSRLVGALRKRPGTHNSRRRTLEAALWRHLHAQAEEIASGGGLDVPERPEDLGTLLKREPAAVEALERMWPLLTPEQLLRDLFGAPALIRLAASGLLSEEEMALLERPRGAVGEETPFTEADIPLLDEALSLLGPRRRANPDPADLIPTFGHVVVDEAQDLAPMQLRMIARRSLGGSLTVVGDIAQATGTWLPASWAGVMEHLPSKRGWKLKELTVSYRTPAEILSLAAGVLRRVAPAMSPPDSVRSAGKTPRFVAVGDGPRGSSAVGGSYDLAQVVRVTTELALEEMVDVASSQTGATVAVIAPETLLEHLAAELERLDRPFGRAGRSALDVPLNLLSVTEAKGLEFDSVIVVEPARIVEESAQGLRSLYVAFTRATQRLAVVHGEPLPSPLAETNATSLMP